MTSNSKKENNESTHLLVLSNAKSSGRISSVDEKFDGDISTATLSNHLFLRTVAKKKKFTNVDFKYSIFDHCYLRYCTFDSCDFTGCRFEATNLSGSNFSCCKFDYCTFERTIVDADILESCSMHENLKMKLARSLRMNFQQLGDTRSVNKTIRVELDATELHLRRAWSSDDEYYRNKYPGLRRIWSFAEWLAFKLLDLIWGNGESAGKLIGTIAVLLATIALIDVFAHKDPQLIESYTKAFSEAPQIFLGTLVPAYYRTGYLTVILLLRLVALGFFTSIIIKRLSRR